MGLFFYTKKGSIISTVDLLTTEIIEPKNADFKRFFFLSNAVYSTIFQFKLYLFPLPFFVRPGLESLGFSWIKNSVVSRLFRTGSTD